jgi:hypothetical protein
LQVIDTPDVFNMDLNQRDAAALFMQWETMGPKNALTAIVNVVRLDDRFTSGD